MCGVAGVGYGAGRRPAAALVGGVVGVVAAAEVGSWSTVVGVNVGQGVGRVATGDAFALVGGGWRSAVATIVHDQRVAASGATADAATLGLSAAGASSRRAGSVADGAGGHIHVASGRAAGGALCRCLCWPAPGCCCMGCWTDSSSRRWRY
jgi:hypothetical protein